MKNFYWIMGLCFFTMCAEIVKNCSSFVIFYILFALQCMAIITSIIFMCINKQQKLNVCLLFSTSMILMVFPILGGLANITTPENSFTYVIHAGGGQHPFLFKL